MPLTLEVVESLQNVSAIGTTDFVTREFIPLLSLDKENPIAPRVFPGQRSAKARSWKCY